MQQHLSVCASCCETLVRLLRVRQLLRSPADPEMPAHTRDRLERFLDALTEVPSEPASAAVTGRTHAPHWAPRRFVRP